MTEVILSGKSKLSNSGDTDGITMGDLLIGLCAAACLLPILPALAHIVPFLRGEPSPSDWDFIPFSNVIFFDHGFTVIIAMFLLMRLLRDVAWKYRDSRYSVAHFDLRSEEGTLPGLVVAALERVRRGRYELKFSTENCLNAKLAVRMPAKKPEVLSEVISSLEREGVEVSPG
jgi:hypothetical protein